MSDNSNQKNAQTPKKHFSSFFRFIFLTAVCVCSSLILVWPLWKFSTLTPKVYTATVIIIIAVLLVYFIIKKIRKSRPTAVIQFFVNLIIICAALFFSASFILHGNRLLGLVIFASGIAAEILVNIIFSKARHE